MTARGETAARAQQIGGDLALRGLVGVAHRASAAIGSALPVALPQQRVRGGQAVSATELRKGMTEGRGSSRRRPDFRAGLINGLTPQRGPGAEPRQGGSCRQPVAGIGQPVRRRTTPEPQTDAGALPLGSETSSPRRASAHRVDPPGRRASRLASSALSPSRSRWPADEIPNTRAAPRAVGHSLVVRASSVTWSAPAGQWVGR